MDKMSSEKQPDNIARLYGALRNSYRRKIVEILRDNGRAGFKELHATLRISVGALYHHLDMLEGIVTQDSDKKYELTNLGRSAINVLGASEERIISGNVSPSAETRLGFLSKEIFLGRTLFRYLNEESVRSLPLAILIAGLGGWVSSQSGLEPLLLFYVNPSSVFIRSWLILLFPLGWLATFAAADLFCIIIFHRKGGDLSLLNGTAFAMLPLLLVPGLALLTQQFAPGRTIGVPVILLSIVLQAWVVSLLSNAISVSKGLKLERTALASLGVMYLNIITLVTALQLGLF
jgi:DNA-binding HxlR family transcriptional regulator